MSYFDGFTVEVRCADVMRADSIGREVSGATGASWRVVADGEFDEPQIAAYGPSWADIDEMSGPAGSRLEAALRDLEATARAIVDGARPEAPDERDAFERAHSVGSDNPGLR